MTMTMAPLTIENVHHIRLTVTDVERARDFYTGVLGFQLAAEFPTPEGVLLSNGDTLLGLRPAGALGGVADDRFAERRVGLDHLSFNAGRRERLDQAARSLDKHGIPRGEIKEMPDLGIAVLAFRDPDNIQLELTAPLN